VPRLSVEEVIRRYMDTKRLISAVAREWGLSVAFAWEPAPDYRYDRRHHLLKPDRAHRDNTAYVAMAEYVSRHPQGPEFIWCADVQEGINRNLYVDRVHLNEEGCGLVARCIVQALAERQLLRVTNTEGAR